MRVDKIYESIINKPQNWDYYNAGIKIDNINNPEQCLNFILQFVNKSEKSDQELYKKFREIYNGEERYRLCHIVSVFFLGIYLIVHNKKFCGREYITGYMAKKKLYMKLSSSDIIVQFQYIWFLTALFHDAGFLYDKEPYIDFPIVDFNQNSIVPSCLFDNMKKYYEYRTSKRNNIATGEHGFPTGSFLLHDLKLIRIKKECSESSDLDWDKSLDEIYNDVSLVIATHNVWFGTKENEAEYSNNGIKGLVLEDDYHIRFDTYPLYFLLALVDTIDPVKAKIDLSNLEITAYKKKIVLKFKNGTNRYSEYKEKIMGLNKWLCICREVEQYKIEINL